MFSKIKETLSAIAKRWWGQDQEELRRRAEFTIKARALEAPELDELIKRTAAGHVSKLLARKRRAKETIDTQAPELYLDLLDRIGKAADYGSGKVILAARDFASDETYDAFSDYFGLCGFGVSARRGRRGKDREDFIVSWFDKAA